MSNDLDRLLTSKEVTEWAGISLATLYRLVAKGEFPKGLTLGLKARRWRLSQLQEYAAQREGLWEEPCG